MFYFSNFFIWNKDVKPTPEEAGHIFQLRDVVLPKFTVFGQQWQVLQVFPAGVGGVQLVELPEHNSPSLHFFFRELNTRNDIPTAARENNYMNINLLYLYIFRKDPLKYTASTHCL